LYPSIVLQQFTTLDLPPGVLAAYDAPFPDERYTAGAHVFPSLATTEAADFQAAWQVLRTYNRPFLTIYGDRDPVLGDQGIVFRSLVPGAVNQPHAWLVDAGHFVQEDRGELLAERLVDWLRQ
jgi:haloalkane dehalogenase